MTRRQLRRPAEASRDDPVVSETVSELRRSVLEGAKTFMNNKKAQLSWYDDLESLRPRKAPCSGADLVTTFIQYSQATGRRCWQAKFLLGCSLLNNRYTHKRTIQRSERACKSLARCIIGLLNSLYPKVGGDAFKVIPAISSKRTDMEHNQAGAADSYSKL